MNANDQPSINETTNLFNSESSKLQDVVNQALQNSEKLSIAEIVETYYQVINVTSLGKFLRQNFEDVTNIEEKKSVLSQIQDIERFIAEKFDENLHLLIMSELKKSTEDYMKKLKDLRANQDEKTKENVEEQAKMYEELRQIMSTKEFVDQYNNGLDNSKN